MKYLIFIFTIVLCAYSCSDDLVETPSDDLENPPVDSLEIVHQTYEMLLDSLSEAYAILHSPEFSGLYVPIMSDLVGEDLKLVEGEANYGWFEPVYRLRLTSTDIWVTKPWNAGYDGIRTCNTIINNAPSVDESEYNVNHLIAEAKAIRAYSLLELVHLYCDAYSQNPDGLGLMLLLDTDTSSTAAYPRSTIVETYARIEEDLLYAEGIYLAEVVENIDRGCMNIRAIQALLARTYLDMEQWVESRDYAIKSLEGIELVSGRDKGIEAIYGYGNSAFTSETIFGFEYTSVNNNIYLSIPSFYFPLYGYSSVRVSDKFVASFEASDYRSLYFSTSDYYDLLRDDIDSLNVSIFKFGQKNSLGDAHLTKIRGAEMYLVAAECEAHLGNNTAAQEYLSILHSFNFDDNGSSENVGDALIEEILLERRKELFGEGFRLNDIKRTQQTVFRDYRHHWDSFSYSPGGPNYYRFVFPIPQSEIDSNEMITSSDQNPGY